MQIGPLKISLVGGPGVSGAAVASPDDQEEKTGGLLALPGGSQVGSLLRLPRRLRSRLQSLLNDQQDGPADQEFGGLTFDPDSPFYLSLSEDLQEQSRANSHVWEYLSELPMDEIGMPEYHSRLTKTLASQEYRNIIYPVSEGIFIHLFPDRRDSRDFYYSIEPSMGPTVPGLMDQVDRRLINFVAN